MRFKIQMVIEDEQGQTKIQEIVGLEKSDETNDVVGLSLSESKDILTKLQKVIVVEQANNYVIKHKNCPHCHQPRTSKGYHIIQYRTLFGIISIPGLRVNQCHCYEFSAATVSLLKDWLPEHTSPELQYIETKWSSLMAYGQTVKLLHDVLPISVTENATTIRRNLLKIAKRCELELEGKPEYLAGCPRDWGNLSKPDKPFTVGLDGGYVRNWNEKKTNFEVIAGKSLSKSKPNKRFGFVQTMEKKPRRRLMYFLSKQGMQANQQVTFLSDGADNLRDLQYRMYPEAEHVLDWFHITMRMTVLTQFAKGMIHSDPAQGREVIKNLTSSKWYLWHGNVEKSLSCLEDCWLILTNEDDEKIAYTNKQKFINQLEEMDTYITNNQHLIPNYGEKWRYGETISTAFVESTVNEVIAKRMVKKQQMQWTPTGAHYLIQTRTEVLNNDLHKHFAKWYPRYDFGQQEQEKIGKAA